MQQLALYRGRAADEECSYEAEQGRFLLPENDAILRIFRRGNILDKFHEPYLH